jgi:1-acyl-sn-glycerol-3-phosphate acyltransferase
MLRPIYLLFFKIFGWKVTGHFPKELKKFIIAVGPHTSNWDFVVGIAARSILGIQSAKFLGKSQLFKAPYGWFFKMLGGYPVDRSQSNDVTDQAAEIFNTHDRFILAVAPEGTRKKVSKLKTGFYYIALKAHVPIIPVGFDFLRKEVIVGNPLYAKDINEDMEGLRSFYKSIVGRNPELGID